MKKTSPLYFSIRKKIVLIFLCFSIFSNAQNANPQIERLQRAIFIFNLAQQVVGYTPAKKEQITIGVLGADRTSIDLRALAQNRTISGFPVSIVSFQKVKDINTIDILYVHEKFNFDSTYILNTIKGKQILLITEDYAYNSSMINIVGVGSGFEYEINEDKLSNENFYFASSLRKNSISSSEKWKRLFKESQSLLEIEQEEVLKKEAEISKKDTFIETQRNTLFTIKDTLLQQKGTIKKTQELLAEQGDSIAKLWTLNEIQSQKYEDKVLLEAALEKQIASQVSFLKRQQNEISKKTNILRKKEYSIELQDIEIEKQQKVLATQTNTINTQRTIVFLLCLIAGLLLGIVYLFYFNYRKKKKLSEALVLKNSKIEAQARELSYKNKELEQFAYIASHDLKEPINTISSLIGMLDEDHETNFSDITKQSFTYINDSIVRMRALIDALLQHSKIGVAQQKESVDCNAVINSITKDIHKLIKDSGATLEIDRLPTIHASSVEIRLVFQNLIVNAIKFRSASRKPKISVSSKMILHPIKEGFAMWQFSISDNGIGIPKEYQEKIFAIFQRLHNKEEYEGTGIGLAHCKKIINAHEGTIWVTSKEREGSTFYFTIPIES